ncbi:MAG: enoyl-CoA hydratase/isomerase family protein [Chloroflexi bacterium]|nr:enoyl-CoA hydratase/isomerase family protein [Chloroflexota bacterium]
MSAFETILLEKANGVAWVTLNRPRVLNAYNIKMRDELFETLGLIASDSDVRVAVFRGAGEKAFCAGADLTEFGSAPSQAIARQVRFERDVWHRFLSLRQPLIAAIHGYCLGSGIEIALCCDIRIASPEAKFGLPETGLGMIPAAGGTQTLPRIVGIPRAMEAVLTGRTMEAPEAKRIGLVNSIEAKDDFFAKAQRLAEDLAALPPRALAYAKEAVHRGADLSLANGLEIERKLTARLAGAA